MRVLVIAGSVGARSGLGRHSKAIVEALKSREIEVHVFAGTGRGILGAYSDALHARRAATGCDIVHALDGWPFSLYGYAAVWGRRTPLFINGIGTYSVAPLYSARKGFLLRRAYARAQVIFCISKYTKAALVRAGIAEEKLLVVHYGAPSLPRPTKEAQQGYREHYGISPERYPIILTVGAIKERKGQFDTLRAIALLKKRYPSVLYIAAGSGNSAAYMREMRAYAAAHGLTDSLKIIEDADDSALAFLYSVATVFALNSITDARTHHFEGFGAAIVEAYQFGKPAVGSRGSGIEDAIAEGESGLLTKQKDPIDIAAKIEQILARYNDFSESATRRYGDFTWEKTVQSYLSHYA